MVFFLSFSGSETTLFYFGRGAAGAARLREP